MTMDFIMKEIADKILPYEYPDKVAQRQRKFKQFETRPSVKLDGRRRRLNIPG